MPLLIPLPPKPLEPEPEPEHSFPDAIRHDNFWVGFCNICGFYHQINPVFLKNFKKEVDFWDIDEYYNNDRFYSEHSPPDWFNKVKKEHMAGLWKSAYDYQISLLKPDFMSGKEKLIDWGTGAGWFLHQWRHYGGMFRGIEPSKTAWANASPEIRPFIITENQLNDLGPRWKGSANNRASLVLEHVFNPLAFLKTMVSYTGMGKRIMIIVPNDFSPLQKKIGGLHWLSKVHYNYFDGPTLARLMNRAGLRMVHRSATFPMELFILMGLDYRNNDELGRKLHCFRLNLEKRFGKTIFDLYTLFHKRWGWGRELVYVGEKKA